MHAAFFAGLKHSTNPFYFKTFAAKLETRQASLKKKKKEELSKGGSDKMSRSDKLSFGEQINLRKEKKNPTTTVTSQIGLNIPVSGEALITRAMAGC